MLKINIEYQILPTNNNPTSDIECQQLNINTNYQIPITKYMKKDRKKTRQRQQQCNDSIPVKQNGGHDEAGGETEENN